MGLTPKTVQDLVAFIESCPIIDNHAHNILTPEGLKSQSLLGITSEADGDAVEDVPTTLAHIRAHRQLRQFYGLAEDTDWNTVERVRNDALAKSPDATLGRYFAGMQTLLLDDRYEDADEVESYNWHSKFTKSPCKRILRLEEVASDILEEMHESGDLPESSVDLRPCWASFIHTFESAIQEAMADPEIVGFKSVICYMTGLDVECGTDEEVTERALAALQDFLPRRVENEFAIEQKGLNDALVICTCRNIAASCKKDGDAKPLQFHTGLGSNNMSLLLSNPAHLQPLIAEYPKAPIVLLHASYPFTREAGYLASTYKNCFLDIGLVWPEVSRDGQEQAIRQSLELTPWSKMLWSTDGHHHPEVFWLSSTQGRKAMAKVMCEYVEQDDLTMEQAVRAVTGIFFENSNQLYQLKLTLEG